MARILNKRLLASALASIFMLHGGQASALGLVEAYQAALQNDPTYQSARHDNEAGQQNRALGRSNLLPQVSISYSKSKNRTDITQPNFLGQMSTTHPDYTSTSNVLGLRQPIFNLDGFARYRLGLAQANISDAQFSSRSQDLVLRLVGAFADAKFAEDQLALATAQRDTFAEQKQANERMFEKGEGTRTDMLETQAKFDLAEAQLIEARDNMTTARNNLAAIIGTDVTQLDGLTDDFQVKPMQPATYEEWKAIALDRNPDLVAQRYNVEAAEQDIARNRAGHAPRLDFVASYSKSDSETLSTRNQDATVRAVGIQLNIPLYSGGSVTAATSQAVANHEKAKSDLDAKTNQVLVELRKEYNLILSSASRIDAMVKSVNSARALVQATQQSVKGGVRVNLDVLNAQQQLFSARKDLAQARYNYLLAYLRLRSAAGTLSAEDLQAVAGYFVPGSAGNATTGILPISVPGVVHKTAEEKAKAPVARTSANDSARKELLALVDGWTKAWSAQDVNGYLDFYASDFQPGNGQSLDDWIRTRRARIQSHRQISVQAESPEVALDGDSATVKFRQRYKSNRLADETRKVLLLARQDGKWKIKQEVSEQ
ncbi:TolC family outer membrane protein [Noviherbaspirillum sp.]|uniref:TolC family outer membrane protein n=1 Tax=Noviherbaspirillum sp. TaxID=1926288 RepID=UPI002B4A2FB8|nr:TolC family outer membrane protein [Noviherbaspirillum sp.]HJV81180.1 TolC family outer membrane protein [Noviherbaspirillum sp.]